MSKELFSKPDENSVHQHADKTLRRNLPMICPVCSDIFYGYKSDDQIVTKPVVQLQDMVPSYSGWLKFRMTCGDTACYLAEEQRWLKQSPAYQDAIDKKNNQFAELNDVRRESLRNVKTGQSKPIKLFSLEDDNG